MSNQARQSAGIPAGGEFKAHDRDESSVELVDEVYEPFNPTYVFPAARMDAALHKIELANRRLERAGISERFAFDTDTFIRNDPDTGMSIEMVSLTLDKPSIGIDGWSFVGAHDFTPDGAVISAYQLDASVQQPADTSCDKCGTSRARERIYTLRDEDGNEQHVGKSCLQAFLGIKPSGMWALDYELFDEEESSDEHEDNLLYRRTSQVYPASDLIVAALAASDDGATFISKSAARAGEEPTAVTVSKDFRKLTAEPTAETVESAKEILTWLESQPGDSEYMANLKAALLPTGDDAKWVKPKHLALAVSAVGARRAARARELEKTIRVETKKEEVKGYLAAPKEKIADVKATVQLIRYFESDYGYHPTTNTMIVMISDSGHVLKWTTSSNVEVEEGQKIVVKGTVKANTVYRDSYQTEIIRAKLESQPVETSAA